MVEHTVRDREVAGSSPATPTRKNVYYIAMGIETDLFILFSFIIGGFLIADLAYFNRKAHKISPQSALIQSLFWFGVAFGFSFLVFLFIGREKAAEFMSAYVTEKMLSVDNLFVIMLIFNFFKIEERYYHKVLFYGIMGAIVFRAIFILGGAVIIDHFHWVLYIFGWIERSVFENQERAVQQLRCRL